MCGFRNFPCSLWNYGRSSGARAACPKGAVRPVEGARTETLLPMCHVAAFQGPLPVYETALMPRLCWMASLTQWAWVWARSGRWCREAWQAAVHGVAKSRTQLSGWTATAFPLDSWHRCLSCPEGLRVTEEKTELCASEDHPQSKNKAHTYTAPVQEIRSQAPSLPPLQAHSPPRKYLHTVNQPFSCHSLGFLS